jgi:hypothetical protein
MINIHIVLLILFVHWFADFVCQTDWQAKNKSINFVALATHTTVYSLVWAVPIAIISENTGNPELLLFIPITWIAHTLTDYVTSKANKMLWDAEKVHEFFVCIGLDQFLHFAQLLLTYYFLTT